jgi:hypothetical protein
MRIFSGVGMDEHQKHIRLSYIVACLNDALRVALSPQMRLRCGSLGRRLRTTEHGLDVVVEIVTTLANSPRATYRTSEGTSRDPQSPITSLRTVELEEELTISVPTLQSQTELNFLYEEIFIERIYISHGLGLCEGDIVLDIGANVGLCSIMLECEFEECNSLRIVAVEPAPDVFAALSSNLRHFNEGTPLYHHNTIMRERLSCRCCLDRGSRE